MQLLSDILPGLNLRRLTRLMHEAIERCDLNLAGKVILTEAATGAYLATPVMAAMAGAKHVYAVTRTTRYGTVEEITSQTLELARISGVEDRISVITQKSEEIIRRVDIITNSGHVRPIDAEMIGWMKPDAVISLMYEAWEFRSKDVDLYACRERGIPVAGVNEQHITVDVFSFLGIMAVKLLLDAGIAVYASTILLLCDNPFAPYIEQGLVAAGSRVDMCKTLSAATENAHYDAILVALHPKSRPVIETADTVEIAHRWPGTVVAQYWGDIDRDACAAASLSIWPPHAPAAGHMGILPSEIGPEPIIRLQSGGLKVGEILASGSLNKHQQWEEYVQMVDEPYVAQMNIDHL